MNFSEKWIIAEIGSVHDGSFGNAIKALEAAAVSGANCIKFQTHIADEESLPNAPSPRYFSSESRIEYFRRTAFSRSQWKELAARALDLGVAFISSPFSHVAVDLLEDLEVPAYKVASGEVTNLPMLEHIAATGKPVILSSGMSTWDELDEAVSTLSGSNICIMQCTSIYPCPITKVGLNNLAEISDRYPEVTIGFSDHTLGMSAGVAAATLGASVIEKHFTFSRLMYGSDAFNSLEPSEFKSYSTMIREAWAILEHPIDKGLLAREELCEMKWTFEKSIVSSMSIRAGTIVDKHHLAYKKPSGGIPPAKWKSIMGKTLERDVPSNHIFEPGDFI